MGVTPPCAPYSATHTQPASVWGKHWRLPSSQRERKLALLGPQALPLGQ